MNWCDSEADEEIKEVDFIREEVKHNKSSEQILERMMLAAEQE